MNGRYHTWVALAATWLIFATGFALMFWLLAGCSGHAEDAPLTCELHGDYTMTVEGCGFSSSRVLSADYAVPCEPGDVCEPEFCALKADGDGCEIWTTFERAPEPIDICCELKNGAFVVNRFCQQTPVAESFLAVNPGYRCWEVR